MATAPQDSAPKKTVISSEARRIAQLEHQRADSHPGFHVQQLMDRHQAAMAALEQERDQLRRQLEGKPTIGKRIRKVIGGTGTATPPGSGDGR